MSPIVVGLVLAVAGCGAHRAPLAVPMEPMVTSPPLVDNHFRRDVMGDLSEQHLKVILEAPVFLEERARIGIVPVVTGYAVDRDTPVVSVPGVVATSLTDGGHFEVVSEVTTDWPTGGSIAGLRELAARYRVEYLLLYRHRFVERSWTNAWALSWLTFIGGFITPQNTIEVAGVLEATLFDVKSGTLLFTAFERVAYKGEENIWQNARKRRDIKARLLAQASTVLADKVSDQVRRLAAARPVPPAVAVTP
ncbi:MAG TPA: hypothetical protein PK095_24465, partial [Myxococcota bacterium]|nr:hypothetical protein [Myxococcota bacterium]